MGARTTLNGIYLTLSLAIAALIGAMTNSWVIFAISLSLLIAARLHSGAIRIKPRRRRGK